MTFGFDCFGRDLCGTDCRDLNDLSIDDLACASFVGLDGNFGN